MPPTVPTRSLKLEFPGGSGARLAGRLELPLGPPRAFALFAHCFTCSKDSAAASRISRALGRRGIAVLRFDFTGLGGSEGDFASTDFSSNVEDLLAAAEHLREHHRAPTLLIGHSLGGAAVLAAASRIPGVRAVATIAAPSETRHLVETLGLEGLESGERARVTLGNQTFELGSGFVADLSEGSMETSIRALEAALLILHSPEDEVVPIEHAARIYRLARHPKSFVSLDGVDHLVRRGADAEFVADVLCAWAARYVEEPDARPEVEPSLESGPEPGTVLVEGRGDGFLQTVSARGHQLLSDEPPTAGGNDLGPTPYDLLLAGLGSCTSMTLGMYARRKSWPLESVAVRLRHGRIHAADCESCESTEGQVDRIEREIAITGDLDETQRARLMEIADRCPVHRTLENEIRIETRAVEAAAVTD